MQDVSRPRIAFTMGDPAGIGPELLVRSLDQITAICSPVLFGPAALLDAAARHEGISTDRFPVELVEIETEFRSIPAHICAENGAFVVAAVREAVSACMSGACEALVTGPISKKAMSMAGFAYPGHTEMLAEFAGVNRTMMLFYSPAFSVVLHTIHVPLRAVPEEMHADVLVDRMRFAWQRYSQLAGIRPKFRVCGVNPHAGEQGRLGLEDREIEKAVEQLKSEGLPISGPFPADTLFARLPADGSCLVYAMYHDQGLIPIKTLYPHQCVNMTLGLPFLRASVSHGTAFDIAWKHRADTRNFTETVRTAGAFLRRKT